MSKSEELQEGVEAVPAGPRPPRAVIALLAVNVALTGLVAFKTLTAATVEAHPAHAADAAPVAREVTGPVIPLDAFVVNLNEPGSARYVKVTMQAELANRGAARAFEKSKQLVRDAILRYLSGLTVADTLGPENKDRIREDLEAAVADVIGAGRLNRMIFAEFVVQ